MDRIQLVAYLDQYLNVAGIPDASKNGLQVEGPADVQTVAFAVDACQEAIQQARAAGAQMLLVHHGLFWEQVLLVTGPHYQRLRTLIEGGLCLYAAHLPLDAHPVVGHNVQLAGLLGLPITGPFAEHHGIFIGVAASPAQPLPRADLVSRLEQGLHVPALVWPFGPEKILRVAIVSGNGESTLAAAATAGFDTLVTGSASHTYYHQARELGLNVLHAGHYATETVGLHALAGHLERAFGLHTVFLDISTGL